MIAAVLLALQAAPLPSGVWASVAAAAARARTTTLVEFLYDPVDLADGEYTLRLTATRPDGPPTVLWASSRTCGGVRTAVTRLSAVPMPSPEMPGDPIEVVMDGTGYTVRIRARYGRQMATPLTLSSNIGTPLAAWVDETFATLEPCWSPVRLRTSAPARR